MGGGQVIHLVMMSQQHGARACRSENHTSEEGKLSSWCLYLKIIKEIAQGIGIWTSEEGCPTTNSSILEGFHESV